MSIEKEIDKNKTNIIEALKWSSGEVLLKTNSDGSLRVIANRKKVFESSNRHGKDN